MEGGVLRVDGLFNLHLLYVYVPSVMSKYSTISCQRTLQIISVILSITTTSSLVTTGGTGTSSPLAHPLVMPTASISRTIRGTTVW